MPRGQLPDATGPERPRTLLTWSAAGRGEDKKDEPADPDAATAPPKEEPLASDRPDFTEASSTVGKGRIQLEAGYTFGRDRSEGATTTTHSYPEALLRVGMFAEWFELRVGQNFGNSRQGTADGVFSTAGGAEDLYLGGKFFLAEQFGILPEVSLVVQAQVPTGIDDFTATRVLPGVNLLYGWDVIPDRLTVAGSSQANRAIDADAHGYVEMAQSLTVGYGLTEKLGAYTEWFAFFPAGATSPGVTALHYFNGGFTYRVTPNFQLDIRAGLGLSRNADDFFTGTGFAVRY
jgi:hypothetical protein